MKVSIVIPYKRRLHTIRGTFAALAEQTMDPSRFEVLVGAMEYEPEYVAACRDFPTLGIRTVMTGEDWNTGRARNLPLPLARGQVVVFLDADMALPPGLLDRLYDHYFQHGQNVCVLGQTLGYDEVVESDVAEAEALPYSHYRQVLADLEAGPELRADPRWTDAYAPAFARFPWAFTRTGLVALPAATIRRHDLTFDQGFHGWGPEDQEWGLRVARTGTPIVLGRDIYGLHLPHHRDVAANGATAWRNNRYYLGKWPRRELELALAYGWLGADEVYPAVERELAGNPLSVVRGLVDGTDMLVVGAPIADRAQVPHTPELSSLFDGRAPYDVLPLAGFALPYGDKSVDECRILPPIQRLSERFQDTIVREAERVSRKLVAPAGDERR
ncbi:glycosyltransferase [Nonomuraea endophytica]|uniref:Glycosyltransferase involved in cell wall biosynthesis n=1 Tax=Nonomuraea endophytica TaxID=714136 RepID=A0A7W8A5X8_9ACTN|nr:glycosyltransferase [Nonomuraea endophytica]MBB5080129.1 glycosyltransferase involved in cell wall biosynthesis [Nonomuraea endophytica]